jgi:hypothetical protein
LSILVLPVVDVAESIVFGLKRKHGLKIGIPNQTSQGWVSAKMGETVEFREIHY